MKKLSSLITSKLFLVAAGLSVGFVGNSFADTVSAYRQSSGTQTNTGVTTYVGNRVWGADSQSFGSKFYSEWAQENGVSLRWDANKKAFLIWEDREVSTFPDENGLTTIYTTEYLSFDTVFALSGSAVFKNEGTANLQYYGEKTMEDWTGKIEGSVGRQEYLYHDLLVAFSDNSKLMNEGTLTFSSTTTSSWGTTTDPDGTMHEHSGQPPQFEVYFRDNAQFLNSGSVSAKKYASSYYGTTVNLYFYENAKVVNEEGGKISDVYMHLFDNAYLENSGFIGEDEYAGEEICLSENGRVVNTVTGKINGAAICFESGYGNAKMKIENYGEISASGIDYDFLYISGNSMEAILENHGVLEFNNMSFWVESYQEQPFSRFENLNKNLQIKNYGTMRSRYGDEVSICSYVDVMLAEGSRVEGKLSLGNSFEYDEYVGVWEDGYMDEILVNKTAQKEKSVLNILITGKDGGTALVSNGIELNNTVVLKFEFDDGFSPKKYTLNLWDGALSGGGYFDTSYRYGNYEVFLSQVDGTITIKDTSIGEEYQISPENGDGAYQLGQKDLAEFGEDLTEFSGTISGNGEVDANYDVTFSGDARGHAGKTVIGGTFTVTKDAYLSQGTYEVGGTLDVLGGEKTFGGNVTGPGTINIQAGTVEFKKTISVGDLNVSTAATLRGNVTVENSDTTVALSGTLSLNADKQEKVSLANGAVLVLDANSKLEIRGDKSSPYSRVAGVKSSRLENGERVVIVAGGKIEGDKDLKTLLEEDVSVSALARQYAVVMYTDNGLSVQVIRNANALSSRVDVPDELREAVGIVLSEVRLDLTPGLKTMDEISGMGGDDPLANAVLTNPEKAGEMVMNILPIHYAAMVSMTTESFHSDVRSIANRLEQRRYDGYAPEKKYEFFFQLQGNSVDNDDDFDSPTFDFDTIGFFAGADYKIDSKTMVGLAVGADFGEAKIHNGGGKLEMSDMRFTGFFGKTLADRFYLNAGAQIGSGAFDIKRKTVWGNPFGDATTWNLGGFVEAGGLIPLTDTVFATPYVGLAYMYTYVDDFEEEGAGALWNVDSFYGSSLRARVGCGFSWMVSIADYKCRFGADVAYSHDFLGEEVDVKVKGDFPTMTVNAMPSDVFSVGPTVDVGISENASVYGGYSFNAGTDASVNHSANVGFRMRF